MSGERARQIVEAMPDWTRRTLAQAMAVSASVVVLAAGIGATEANALLARLHREQADRDNEAN